MSLWYKLKLRFPNHSLELVKNFYPKFRLKNRNTIPNICVGNIGGYDRLPVKLYQQVYANYKFMFISYPLSKRKFFFKKYHDSQTNDNDSGLMLSGFGLMVALCEAKKYTKRKRVIELEDMQLNGK